MVAYQYRMPSGIPGVVSRIESATVTAEIISVTTPPTAYGNAVVLDTDGVRPVTTGDVADDIYGAYVRPYPTTGGVSWPNQPLTTGAPGTPPVQGICNILKRGFISVFVGGTTTAAKGGTVYIRVANASAGKPIGGYEAAADGANTIIFTGAQFMGPQDSQGQCEISVFIGPHQ